MRIVTAFIAGLVFGLGLLLSGMADPAKVLGFLDLAGAWDPSLVFVMGGAVGAATVAFAAARRRKTSVLGEAMQLPTKSGLDRRLVAGALLFGTGWGLAGFCPGPAIVALGVGEPKAVVFVAAMLAGMVLFAFFERRRANALPAAR
ncbi:MAG TPA: DUF6691 family protein [Burkholderiaceae bacterium]